MASFLARLSDLPATGTDYFHEDGRSIRQKNINRLAAAGMTGGCTTILYCRRDPVQHRPRRSPSYPAN